MPATHTTFGASITVTTRGFEPSTLSERAVTLRGSCAQDSTTLVIHGRGVGGALTWRIEQDLATETWTYTDLCFGCLVASAPSELPPKLLHRCNLFIGAACHAIDSQIEAAA